MLQNQSFSCTGRSLISSGWCLTFLTAQSKLSAKSWILASSSHWLWPFKEEICIETEVLDYKRCMQMIVFEVTNLKRFGDGSQPEENLIGCSDVTIAIWLDSRSLSLSLSQWNWAYDTLYFDQLLSRSNELRRPWCLSQCAMKNKTRGLLDFPILYFQSEIFSIHHLLCICENYLLGYHSVR